MLISLLSLNHESVLHQQHVYLLSLLIRKQYHVLNKLPLFYLLVLLQVLEYYFHLTLNLILFQVLHSCSFLNVFHLDNFSHEGFGSNFVEESLMSRPSCLGALLRSPSFFVYILFFCTSIPPFCTSVPPFFTSVSLFCTSEIPPFYTSVSMFCTFEILPFCTSFSLSFYVLKNFWTLLSQILQYFIVIFLMLKMSSNFIPVWNRDNVKFIVVFY